jgi:hypothetical protein
MEIELLRLTRLIQNSNKEKQANKFHLSCCFSVSVDGRYIYECGIRRSCSIVKLSWPRSVKLIAGFSKTAIYDRIVRTSFVPVTNGVFVSGEIRKVSTGRDKLCAGIPELWNFGVTQRLASFPELTGTYYCLSVAQDLVACVMESQVCFFNVLKKTIIARTPFPEHILIRQHNSEITNVIACSSLYHVLMRKRESTYLLQYANSVDLNSCVFNNIIPKVGNYIVSAACFSPNGQTLVFRLWGIFYILDIATLNIRGEVSLDVARQSTLAFVDEEHLLCGGYEGCLYLINVKTCDTLTCISLGMPRLGWAHNLCGVFACRNTVGIIVYCCGYNKLKLIKLWLPQERKDGNELLECSCWIHGGNINDPPTPTEIPTTSSKCSII